MSKPTFEIVVTENDQEIARYRLGPGEYYAGSVEGCTIRIPNAATRNFAKISIGANQRVMVEDLESASGTLLDNLPIVAAGWAPGHPLRFGSVVLELWSLAQDGTRAPRTRAIPTRAKRVRTTAVARRHEREVRRRTEPARPPVAVHLGTTAAAAAKLTGAQPKRWWLQWKPLATAAAVAILLMLFGGLQYHAHRVATAAPPSDSAEAQLHYLRALRAIEHRHFETALWQIEMAITLAPGEASYYFVEGNILESLQAFGRASAAYTHALERDPGHTQARANRELCDEILASDGSTLSAESRARLAELMRSQRRESEATAMERL